MKNYTTQNLTGSNYEKKGRDKSMKKRKFDRECKRIYGKYWAEHPFCEMCSEHGIIVPSEIIHNKLLLCEGGTNDPDNLIALCLPCFLKCQLNDVQSEGQKMCENEGQNDGNMTDNLILFKPLADFGEALKKDCPKNDCTIYLSYYETYLLQYKDYKRITETIVDLSKETVRVLEHGIRKTKAELYKMWFENDAVLKHRKDLRITLPLEKDTKGESMKWWESQ